MKTSLITFLTVLSAIFSCSDSRKDSDKVETSDFVSKSFDVASQHLSNAVAEYQDLSQFPRSTNPDGSLHAIPARDWTSGFFPGSLWYMYEYSNEEKFKEAATKWTEALSEQQYNTATHDVGFMINCSYGNGLRLTENKAYQDVMVQTARSLMTRYDETVGCTKSWDWSKRWQFPVIIDNMMNMELLFEASKLSGNDTFRNAAINHSLTTIKNHFRDDHSSYHVVDYDSITGEVLEKVTHQGVSDESAWARGQAWGLYGFTVLYRETRDEVFLNQAKNIAGFILSHTQTPDDLVPYWDYDAPGIPEVPRDASAAAIIASALLELSSYDQEQSAKYFDHAEGILTSLASDEYLAAPGTNNNFILKHSTGNLPANSEIDVPLNYADYYFLEALLRYKKMNK
ncbi:MAG: glucuronyl hydrolase [Cyclobacteriaceae bacterium]|nr:glucuronyl hydrolase [Cyclobacteriaceae bacterium]